ncbi:SDR family NAD(P)-dependent oxidoreductase [Kineococcus gynurae]|uniref:SDR family NAD(P)-dependent oxidoreductase n=1 Tax=Kineococcus gynurae TaxID=452979 RepID=A0ABV5LXJ6_9ACTN
MASRLLPGHRALRYDGRTVLVTGASSGIGAGLAEAFADRGADLVLVARRGDVLASLAAALRARFGVRVEVLAIDLTAPEAGRTVRDRLAELGRDVDVLVNNAGFAVQGPVAETEDVDRLTAQITLNCTALVDLTARLLPDMVARGSGTVVNVSSVAAFQPVPGLAVYGATKAFVLAFTEALWAENRRHGVRVLAVCPGPTETPFFDVAGEDAVGALPRRSVDQVVATTIRALEGNAPVAVDGLLYRALTVTTRLVPRRVLTMVAGAITSTPHPRARTEA